MCKFINRISYILLALTVVLLNLLSCNLSSSSIDDQLSDAETLLLKNSDSALHVLQSMEPFASKEQLDADNEQDALWAMLTVWSAYRNYEKYIDVDLLEVAFNHFKESNDNLRRAQAYYLHSVVREDQKKGEEEEWAQDMYEACLSIAKTEDHVLAAQIYQRYAVKISGRREYEEAVIWNEKYLKEAQISNNLYEQITALMNLSTNWLFIEDDNAKKASGSLDGKIVSQYTKYPMAFKIIRQADSIASANNLVDRQSKVYARISHFFSRVQEADSALHYAILAKNTDEELLAKGKLHNPVVHLYVADAYRKLGNADSALHYAMKDINNPSLISRANASHLISQVYNDLKHDYEQTVIWQNLYFHQQDSLREKEKALAVNQVKQDNAVLVEKMKKEEQGLSWLIYILAAFAVGLIASIIVGRRKHKKRLKMLEDEMNMLIEAKNSIDKVLAVVELPQEENNTIVEKEKEVETDPEVSFVGGIHDTLTIPVSSIVYITSESNYLRIQYRHEDGPAKQRLVRMTMIQAEELLSRYPRILRCHRAFIVNLDYVLHFSSGSGSYTLKLKDTVQSIPVSKTYLQTIKERISL